MQVGDLVRKLPEWERHNPWMRGFFEDDGIDGIGVIVEMPTEKYCKVLWNSGEDSWLPTNRLETLR